MLPPPLSTAVVTNSLSMSVVAAGRCSLRAEQWRVLLGDARRSEAAQDMSAPET
jgi:hypothetical protein